MRPARVAVWQAARRGSCGRPLRGSWRGGRAAMRLVARRAGRYAARGAVAGRYAAQVSDTRAKLFPETQIAKHRQGLKTY